MKKLLFVVNTTSFFLSHRLPIALAAKDAGYEVHIATGTIQSEAEPLISQHGLIYHQLPLSRSGRNFIFELRSLWAIKKLMEKLRPDIVHLVTIKAVIYGGLAARLTKIKALVAAISGLGSVFTANGYTAILTRRLVILFYRLALKHPNQTVVFQNNNDRSILIEVRAVLPEQTILVTGSGIDLNEYVHLPEPNGIPVIVFASRLLKEKGLLDFVASARLLKQRGVEARFLVAGTPDPDNPSTITEAELSAWQVEGIVEILGYRSDIAQLFSQSHIVCLPSYYGEGLPKVLIEAAGCGRVAVTTDHTGCRDAIIAGKTGLLVSPRDPVALADALEILINDSERRIQMGAVARQHAEKEFDICSVVDTHLRVYQELTSKGEQQ